MFDLQKSVHKQDQLKADMINGLSDISAEHQEPVQHVNDTDYEVQAICEDKAISRAFRSRTTIRLKRTYKQGGDTFPTGSKHRAVGRNW